MFKKNDGNDYLISVANNKIYESAGTAFNSPTDRTGSLSFTTTALQFVTFNNKCVAAIPDKRWQFLLVREISRQSLRQ